jgi:predicted ferric reductase
MTDKKATRLKEVSPSEDTAMLLPTVVLMLIAIAVGALTAAAILPTWVPALSGSLLGENPKAPWYLARSSAFAAYGLLWLAMLFGLLMTNRLARVWPGGPTAFDLHQYASLLGLGMALFHTLILLGDRYIGYTPVQLFVPFASLNYQPFWIGLGQVAFYLLVIVSFSFYVKRWLGRQAWRTIHGLSFALFALALLHGIFSGSDTASGWVQLLYWVSGASTLFLVCFRIVTSRLQPIVLPHPLASARREQATQGEQRH